MTSSSVYAVAIVPLLILSIPSVSAFSLPLQHLPGSIIVQTSLHSIPAVAFGVDTEPEAEYCMARARECAFSDSCSVEEANVHLRQVLHIQSGCAAGSLLSDGVCHNQDSAAETVALLREKGRETRYETVIGIVFQG